MAEPMSHREGLTYRPTVKPLSSSEVKAAHAARDFERREFEAAKLREEAVAHRLAPAHRAERLSSWAAPKSPAQAAFEARTAAQKKAKGVSSSQRMQHERDNYADKMDQQAFGRTKELEMKVKKQQRGVAGEEDLSSPKKRVQQRDWEDAIRQNRTEARKQQLLKCANVPIQRKDEVEEAATHRTLGHLTDAEVADYGMIEGETLDEEGRVIPPWSGRAERYSGPGGEDEVRYPFDYGYGARGHYEASRGKMPPPQLFLKDKTSVPRRDPDLYNPVAPYEPYGGFKHPVHPGLQQPGERAAIAYERAAYGYGYGYGLPPAFSHPVYG